MGLNFKPLSEFWALIPEHETAIDWGAMTPEERKKACEDYYRDLNASRFKLLATETPTYYLIRGLTMREATRIQSKYGQQGRKDTNSELDLAVLLANLDALIEAAETGLLAIRNGNETIKTPVEYLRGAFGAADAEKLLIKIGVLVSIKSMLEAEDRANF